MYLNEVKAGNSVVIQKVGVTGAGRRRLVEMGFTPRARITVYNIAPGGGALLVGIRGYMIAIRENAAKAILVKSVEKI